MEIRRVLRALFVLSKRGERINVGHVLSSSED